jgi:CHASE3 domain sensor protein
MKKFLSDNWIVLVIGVSFVVSTTLALRNNYIIERNRIVQEQTDQVKLRTREILSLTMHGLDLGVRGFGLTRDEALLIPYQEAIATTPGLFAELDSLLAEQQYSERNELVSVKREIDNYINFSNEMIQHARDGKLDLFAQLLKEDRGYKVWAQYNAFATPLFAFEDALNMQSIAEYRSAIQSNLIIQIMILIAVMPMLVLFVSKVKRERRKRELLLKEVETTDKTYVFNPGGESDRLSEDINKRSIDNVKHASELISAIATGNYDVTWQGLNKENNHFNKQTLAGNLMNLRDRLVQLKTEDEKRNWTNEGVAKFSDIVRDNQHHSDELSIKCISFLTRYIQAQQGSLFVVEGEPNDQHLKLGACYAFDRKKWVEKRVEIGSGQVGQVYLEGESVMITDVPKGYTTITSGLGTATPSCIIIIPMKSETTTVAVAEFATFAKLEQHQISFLEKAGEYLASAILSSNTTTKMQLLLEQATEREATMKQREEELRQNMEELQATQEALTRQQPHDYNFKKSA